LKSFEPLLSLLGRIRDPRRAEGQTLPTAARVAVFDLRVGERGKFVSRAIRTYVSAMDVETAFREHAADLNLAPAGAGARVIAFDGKTLKGSFDNFNDIKAKQVLTAFAVDTALVLAHIEIDEKSNEIAAVQKLLEELDLAGHIVTGDAMHCQKNFRSRRRRRCPSDRSTHRMFPFLGERDPGITD
jgi:hypothetical protein